MDKIMRIKPKNKEDMMAMDYKPRKYPQLVIPRENFPEPDECEPGMTYYIELECKLWENDMHEDEKGETGKLSFDILAVHEVEDLEEEKKEPKEENETNESKDTEDKESSKESKGEDGKKTYKRM